MAVSGERARKVAGSLVFWPTSPDSTNATTSILGSPEIVLSVWGFVFLRAIVPSW